MLTYSPVLVPPGGYAVLAEAGDTRFPDLLCPLLVPENWDALRRDSDVIVITNGQGRVIDSVHYQDDWFPVAKGVSIERMSPSENSLARTNWQPSLHGGGHTVGFSNSHNRVSVQSFSFSIGKRLFKPEQHFLSMQLNVPRGYETDLMVFDIKGRLIRTFYERAVYPVPSLITWDGRNQKGGRVAPGPYIVYCSVRQDNEVKVKKIPVVVAPN